VLKKNRLDYKQQLLDEIAGNIKAKSIKKGVVPLAKSLVAALNSGNFTLSAGVSVLAERIAGIKIAALEAVQIETAKLAVTPASCQVGLQILTKSGLKRHLDKSINLGV